MAGGGVYISTPLAQSAVFDAGTGEVLWVYDPEAYLSDPYPHAMVFSYNSRGFAYWTDGQEERLLYGTNDGYLLAVDAKTGQPARSFGKNGRVDLMEGILRAVRGTTDSRGNSWLGVVSRTTSSSRPPSSRTCRTTWRPHRDGSRGSTSGRATRSGRSAHSAAGRRLRRRQLAERLVALLRQHERLVDDERRRRAWLYLSPNGDPDERLLRRPIASATTSSPKVSWRSTSRPVSGCGTSRRSITGCGTMTSRRTRT